MREYSFLYGQALAGSWGSCVRNWDGVSEAMSLRLLCGHWSRLVLSSNTANQTRKGAITLSTRRRVAFRRGEVSAGLSKASVDEPSVPSRAPTFTTSALGDDLWPPLVSVCDPLGQPRSRALLWSERSPAAYSAD